EPRGHRLAEERVPDRPLAADAEPGHDARGEERGDLRRQAAEDRPGAVGEDGPLEDRLSPEAVAEVAEERAAHRRRPERRAEQHGMRLAPEAELARDRCEQERVEDQVVEIEEPARPGEGQDAVVDRRRALVVEEIRRAGGEAVPNTDSVATWDGAARLIGTAIERWGRLDALVTCAGILRDRMVFNMSEEEWDAVIAVHLKGTFNCVRHGCTHMRERR